MVKKIQIGGLFDLYDYEIDFNNDPNILILTGPNGFGKTSILNIINHFCAGDLWYFYFLPFDIINIDFDDDISFELKRIKLEERDQSKSYRVSIRMVGKAVAIHSFAFDSAYIYSLYRKAGYVRLGSLYAHKHQDDLIANHYSILQDDYLQENFMPYIDFIHGQKCLMIEEQRIVSRTAGRDNELQIKSVEEIQEHLASFYTSAQKAYNQASLKIDGTFVQRLSKTKESDQGGILKHISKEKIYKTVVKQIADYKRYGFAKELDVVSDLGIHYNEVLKLYLKDIKDKLDSISEYYHKIALFDRLVSGKRLSHKRLVFENDGFSIKNANDDEVPIWKLSSGEQNLLILCYKLVFGLDNKNILLLDEPENSLHVAWLESLLSDYRSIAKASGSQIIIATHSPVFIHGNWNLTYDLCENGKLCNSKGDS